MDQEEELERLEENWNALGEKDPMWAVLYDPDKKGNNWDPDEFYATGSKEISALITYLTDLGLEPSGARALDFGCGLGRLTQPLADHYELAMGVDIAASMIDGARARNTRGDRCEFVLNVAADLSRFDDASFDLVHSRIVLQHIPVDLALGYMREFVRIARPGAIITFDFPSGPVPGVKGFVAKWTPRAALNVLRRIRYRDTSVMEMHWLPAPDVIAAVAECGARLVDDRPIPAAPGAHVVKHQFCFVRS